MKLNNETKIGLLAVIVIALLIAGFNFLRGKNPFRHESVLYAEYQDVQGLAKSNPVMINGLQVGRIKSLDGGKDMRKIMVTLTMLKDVNIPKNSLALINPSFLGSPSMEIQLGDSRTYLQNGDTLVTSLTGSAFNEALKIINPVLYEVKNAVKSLDSVLHLVTSTFDPNTKNNIKDIVANLNTVTASFAVTANSLETMMDAQNGVLSHSLSNVNAFTSNLNSNNERLNSIMENAKLASDRFAGIQVQKSLDSLDVAINSFKEAAGRINSKEGSLGLLLNDNSLYNNLQSTSNKINILIDDIRVHPKRYVGISIFGKKDKGNYITAPLIDDTLKVIKP